MAGAVRVRRGQGGDNYADEGLRGDIAYLAAAARVKGGGAGFLICEGYAVRWRVHRVLQDFSSCF